MPLISNSDYCIIILGKYQSSTWPEWLGAFLRFKKGLKVMIQGTTPTHKFNMQIDPAIIKSLSIAYSQHGDVVLKKSLEDCTISENAVTVKLTQKETLLFNENSNVQIQVRVLTLGDDALASRIMQVPIHMILDKVVLE